MGEVLFRFGSAINLEAGIARRIKLKYSFAHE
jgi:hypothetical protein